MTNGLTPRQLACLGLVGRGFSSKEIARELGISPRTVDLYVSEACQRLGVRTRAQAAAEILRDDAGILPPR